MRQVKLRLAYRVSESLDNRELPDVAAAKLLAVPIAGVRTLRGYKLRGLSIDLLMTLVTTVDRDIEIVVRQTRGPRTHLSKVHLRTFEEQHAKLLADKASGADPEDSDKPFRRADRARGALPGAASASASPRVGMPARGPFRPARCAVHASGLIPP